MSPQSTAAGLPGLRLWPDPELALLLLCACPGACAPDAQALSRAAGRVADWDRFWSLAHRHGLVPLIHALDRRLPFLPQAVSARAAKAARGAAMRSLRYSAALIRVVHELEQGQVPALALKGPTLGALAYGDPGLRVFADLDVLVDETCLARALEILTALGYLPVLAAERHGVRYPLAGRQDLVLQHPQSNVVIELHWRLARSRVDLRLSTSAAFAGAQTVELLGHHISTLGPGDQFLYLTAHAAGHGWTSLEHLRCLGEIVTRDPSYDWQTCVRDAGSAGLRTRTHMSVILLSGLGLTWDPRIIRAALADRRAAGLAREAQTTWARAESALPGDVPRAWLHLRSLDASPARVRFAAASAFAPDESDWGRAATLHPALYPLYYLIHPVRVAARSIDTLRR